MKKLTLLILLGIAVVVLVACQDDCKNNDSCYFDKALAQNESFYCMQIQNSAIQRSCLAELAIKNVDITKCQEISSGYCIEAIAQNTNNSELCKSIEDQNWYDICFFNFAMNSTNGSLCREISEIQKRDECHATLAAQNNQTELCYFILDPAQRDNCVAKRAIATTDSNLCFYIKEPVTKAVCYFKIAENSGKEKICDNIQVTGIRNDCKAKFKKS